MHRVELIAVGTELLLGNIVNGDAQMLSQGLSALGLNVFYHTVVGDNPQRLEQAVAIARDRADIIITTGGLGPTCDDLTKTVLAKSFGKELVYDERSAQRIREFFDALHRNTPMTDNNLQQAMLPEGATIFDNHWGTAPGCAFCVDNTHVIMLPGPPRECTAMFRHWVVPYLQGLSEGIIVSRTLRVFGLGESSVEDLLRDRMNQLENPTLAPYAKEGEVELRITAKAADEATALALIAPVEQEVRGILGHKIYGVNVANLEQVCFEKLQEQGLTLAAAESCTGGLIAKRFTDLVGSSAVFLGGVVAYHSAVKTKLLGVDEKLIAQHTAVHPDVARAMAQGVRTALGSDLAVATTGVAGPGDDSDGNPEGLCYIAIATPTGTFVRTLHGGAGRTRVRNLAANHALDLVRRYLDGLLTD